MLAELPSAADAATETLAFGVVREYLSRQGFKAALSELDAARPPADEDLTSRADIVRLLKLEPLLQANRKRAAPLRTLLELLVSTFYMPDDDDDEPSLLRRSSTASTTFSVSLPSGGPLAAEAAAAAATAAAAAAAAATAASLPPAPPAPPVPTASAARPRPARPQSAKRGVRTPNTLPPGFEASGDEADTAAVVAPLPVAPPKLADPNAPQRMVLSDRRSERLVVQPGELNGGCCELSDLVDCEVLVLDWTQQVTIDGCRGCRVLVGPVDGSLMLRECSGVRLSAVCRQLRTRDCDECVLRLFTLKPIIESSTRMSFGPWNAAYPKLAMHLAKANIDPEAFRCKWFAVHDFNEPELAPGATPANWALLPVETFGERWAVELELLTKDHGASENPLPLELPDS